MQRLSVKCAIGSLAGGFALAAITAGTAAAGDVTFAQYGQVNRLAQQWSITTSGGISTISAVGKVYFAFSCVTGFTSEELAAFMFSATSEAIGNCADFFATGESLTQADYGAFSFIGEGSDPGLDLLSGVFQVTEAGAQFNWEIGYTSESFDAGAASGDLNRAVLSPVFLNFNNQAPEDASWSSPSLIPDYSVGTAASGETHPAYNAFDSSATGTVSSNPGYRTAPNRRPLP